MAAINSKRIRAKYCTDNFLVLTFTIAAHIKGWFTMAKSHLPICYVAPVVKCVDQVQLGCLTMWPSSRTSNQWLSADR